MDIDVTKPRAGTEPVVLPFDAAYVRGIQAAAIRRHAAHAAPLTAILDVPRRIDFAGRPLTVGVLRLVDLAELQAWIEAEGHPLAGFDPATPEPERTAQLRGAWAASESWPPRLGTPDSAARLASLAGRAALLGVATRRHHPELSAPELAGLVAAASHADWTNLTRILWGIGPRAEIVNLVEPDPSSGPGVDWRQAITRVVETYHWTFREVGDLTVSQWAALGSGGKATGGTGAEGRLKRARIKLEGDASA